jgi:predicted Zn-dependent protease
METERLQQLKQLAVQQPGDAFLQYAIALELVKMNDLQAAALQFRNLMEEHSSYVPAFYQYAQLLLSQGDHVAAQRVIESGIAVAIAQSDMHAAGELRELLSIVKQSED